METGSSQRCTVTGMQWHVTHCNETNISLVQGQKCHSQRDAAWGHAAQGRQRVFTLRGIQSLTGQGPKQPMVT